MIGHDKLWFQLHVILPVAMYFYAWLGLLCSIRPTLFMFTVCAYINSVLIAQWNLCS